MRPVDDTRQARTLMALEHNPLVDEPTRLEVFNEDGEQVTADIPLSRDPLAILLALEEGEDEDTVHTITTVTVTTTTYRIVRSSVANQLKGAANPKFNQSKRRT